MIDIISGEPMARLYAASMKTGAGKPSERGNSFLDVVSRMAGVSTLGNRASAAGDLSGLTGAAAVGPLGQVQTGALAGVRGASLEDMLKAKYPGLSYHVLDASTSYWKTRNDYPHYLLYQEGAEADEALKNWKPSGENPFYGSIDGRFIAPKEIHALSQVAPGSKAVAIHPKVQERMEEDPAYAQEIFEKIDTWFAFDVARNEAIMPGSTWDMSQAVAIGEDGNICNACASSANGEITCSKSGPDDEESGWDLRMKRFHAFMQLHIEAQLGRTARASQLLAASARTPDAGVNRDGPDSIANVAAVGQAGAAKAALADMLTTVDLRGIFGDTLGGASTDTVLELAAREAGLAG